MHASDKIKFKYWQDEDFWVGFLLEYPDYLTQGKTLEELRDHLADLYKELTSGEILGVRRVGELDVR